MTFIDFNIFFLIWANSFFSFHRFCPSLLYFHPPPLFPPIYPTIFPSISLSNDVFVHDVISQRRHCSIHILSRGHDYTCRWRERILVPQFKGEGVQARLVVQSIVGRRTTGRICKCLHSLYCIPLP